jgi:twitching motility protein PilT
MTARVSRQLGEHLLDRRLISRDTLEHLLIEEEQRDTPLARLLLEGGHVSEKDLLSVVADRLGIRYVDLDATIIQPEALDRIQPAVAHRFTAVPVAIDGESILVAVADPFVDGLRETIESVVASPVEVALAPKSAIDRILNEYLAGADVEPAAMEVKESLHLNDLLNILMDRKGSDLHLTAGVAPSIRVNGSLSPIEEFGMMMPAELRRIIYDILTTDQRQRLEDLRELDASHPVPGRGRFRVNVFFQRDSVGAVLRAIPNEIMRPADLGMPEIVDSFAHLHRGLVLVTGPTGSGKSTTLASIVNIINEERAVHIMTIEDPIEFLHKHKKALVNQREVGSDTHSFGDALKHVLRQDPDVILVGEMRDLETISAALTAAETGHLVFGTLHTQSAPQSIDRIIDVFPSHQQDQIRVQLAASIQGVVSQQLLPTSDGEGRMVAVEVMIATAAIRNQIRDGKVHQIPSAMQAGAKYGMQTMDQSLAALVKSGRIERDLAFERCADSEALARLLGGG